MRGSPFSCTATAWPRRPTYTGRGATATAGGVSQRVSPSSVGVAALSQAGVKSCIGTSSGAGATSLHTGAGVSLPPQQASNQTRRKDVAAACNAAAGTTETKETKTLHELGGFRPRSASASGSRGSRVSAAVGASQLRRALLPGQSAQRAPAQALGVTGAAQVLNQGALGQFLDVSVSAEKGDLPASGTSGHAVAAGSAACGGGSCAGCTDATLATNSIPANSPVALSGRLPDKQLQSQAQRLSDNVPALPVGGPPRPLGQRSAAPRPNRCWATPQNNQNQEACGSMERDAASTIDERPGAASSARARTAGDGRRPLPAPTSGRPGSSQGMCAGSGNNAGQSSPPRTSSAPTQPATSSKPRQSSSRPLSAQGSASASETSSGPQPQTVGSLPQPRSGRGGMGSAFADMHKPNDNPGATIVEHPQQRPELGIGADTDLSKRTSSTNVDGCLQNGNQSNGQHSGADAAAAKNSRPKHDKAPKAGSGGATDNSTIKNVGTVPSGAISTQRGPGADGDPEGALYGAECLPMVGAAGVLVLPRRADAVQSSKLKQCSKAEGEDDVVALLGDAELFGWVHDTEAEDRVAHRLFDAHVAAKKFTKYVAEECSSRNLPWPSQEPVDVGKLRELTAEQQPSKPAQGPALLQLAHDPRRREECPVCSAEWSQAMSCIAEGRPPPEKEALPAVGRRQNMSKKKMHSLRCNWAWFQQNLCASLCGLRFDAKGAARPSPPSPGRILPPPMFDIWQYWKKTGRSSETRDRQAASERLTRGESVAA